MIASAVRVVCRGAVCAAFPLQANTFRPYLFRHPVLAFLNAFLLVLTLGTAAILSLTPELARLSTITAPTIVKLTNAERVRESLPPLAENPGLQRAAQLKAEHMLRYDYFEHTSPDGLSPWVWFDRVNYHYTFAGENLAIDFLEAEDVVTAWMRSQGHRRNILNTNYTEIGIAAATGEFEGRTATVVVQHFGARARPARGAVAPFGLPAVAGEQEVRPFARGELPPPVILEPADGAVLGPVGLRVRGAAPQGSTVTLLLDRQEVGTTLATDGTFTASVRAQDLEERPATLTALARRGTQQSRPSLPVQLALDTLAPSVPSGSGVLLPDPRGLPGHALLAVSTADAVAHATVVAPSGGTPVPLEAYDGVLTARLALDDLFARIPADRAASADSNALTVTLADAEGNAHTLRVQHLLSYATAEPPADAPRARVADAITRVRPWTASTLALLSALLAINILLHVRVHRLIHADVLFHALVVITIGAVLVLWT